MAGSYDNDQHSYQQVIMNMKILSSRAYQKKILFALIMAAITGSLASGAGVIRNYGLHPETFHVWLRAFEVSYPTIVFSILVIAPIIQKMIQKLLP